MVPVPVLVLGRLVGRGGALVLLLPSLAGRVPIADAVHVVVVIPSVGVHQLLGLFIVVRRRLCEFLENSPQKRKEAINFTIRLLAIQNS